MKKLTAIYIPVDGEEEEVQVSQPLSLKHMQEYVEGYVEAIWHVPDPINNKYNNRFVMIVNEEGTLQKLPPNPNAIARLGRLIVGNVILMDRKLFV